MLLLDECCWRGQSKQDTKGLNGRRPDSLGLANGNSAICSSGRYQIFLAPDTGALDVFDVGCPSLLDLDAHVQLLSGIFLNLIGVVKRSRGNSLAMCGFWQTLTFGVKCTEGAGKDMFTIRNISTLRKP